MHLGTIISRLEREQDATAALEALDNLTLYAQTAEIAARFDETAGEYAAAAVSRFASAASDEEWVGLIGALGQADDPARTALSRMLRWALRRDVEAIVQEAAGHCACCGPAEHGHGAQ